MSFNRSSEIMHGILNSIHEDFTQLSTGFVGAAFTMEAPCLELFDIAHAWPVWEGDEYKIWVQAFGDEGYPFRPSIIMDFREN